MGAASPLMPTPGMPAGGAPPPANANVVMTVPLIKCIMIVESNATRTKELNDTNWNVWKGSIKHIFGLCDLLDYVSSNVDHPDPAYDPVGAKNWDFNDSYAAMLIVRTSLSGKRSTQAKTTNLTRSGGT